MVFFQNDSLHFDSLTGVPVSSILHFLPLLIPPKQGGLSDVMTQLGGTTTLDSLKAFLVLVLKSHVPGNLFVPGKLTELSYHKSQACRKPH